MKNKDLGTEKKNKKKNKSAEIIKEENCFFLFYS